jgi:hypothetical protein
LYFDDALSAAITGVFTSAALGRRIMVEQFDEDAMHSVSAKLAPSPGCTGIPIFESRADYRYS